LKTRRHFLETIIDIGSGYVIAVVMQILIFPLFGIQTSYFNMFIIGGIFMSVSMLRSWLWRKYFHNRFYDKTQQNNGNNKDL
tara:strand:+ start:5169 stop:5414 length:246 start_codon:yes stop_codon:yes gene_type:complete